MSFPSEGANGTADITGGSINATPIGQTTPADGAFTALTASQSARIAGQLSLTANTNAASPTNSGFNFGSSPTWAMMQMYDQALTANNRTADMLFISGGIKFRFTNDARNAFLDALTISGGQASGVTGITSTSGSGAWSHTGAFAATANISTVASIIARAGGPNAPDISTSGAEMFCNTAGNQSNLVLVDSSRLANEKLAMVQWQAGTLNIGFSNDAWSSGVYGVRISGGSTGITGVQSSSGSGAWQHTGNLTLETGTITKYSGVATVANGIPSINGAFNSATTLDADVTSTTLYAVPVSKGGMYRVFAYAVVVTPDAASSLLPNIGVGWTDLDTSVALLSSNVTPTNPANASGAFGNGDIVINAKEGTDITFHTSNYASGTAGTMKYAVRIRLEYLG